MSVSTAILTTASEIWALAVPPDTASARPAATAAASDFMVSSPRLLVEGFGSGPVLSGFARTRQANFWAWRHDGRDVGLKRRQRADGGIDGAFGLHGHAQRPGVE